MSAPFRTIFKDERKIVEIINDSIETWKLTMLQKQGLSNFGIFSRSTTSSKEELLQETISLLPPQSI